MKWFFVTPFTINVLNITLLVVFMVYFLSRNRGKSKATISLIVFLSGVSVVFFSFVLIFSSLNCFYSTIGWWAIHMMVFASVSMVQFAYLFPKNLHISESKIVIVLTIIAAILTYPYYIYSTLQMEPVYSFEGNLYAYFNTPEIGIVIGMELVWIVILFMRKSISLSGYKDILVSPGLENADQTRTTLKTIKRSLFGFFEFYMRMAEPKQKDAKALRNLAIIFISPVALVLVIVMAYQGFLTWKVVAHILGTGFIVVVFFFIILYINNSSEPSTFMIKLIGISLGIILITLSIAANIALSIREDSYMKARLMEAAQLKREVTIGAVPNFPESISYVLVSKGEGGMYFRPPEMLFSSYPGLTASKLKNSIKSEYTKRNFPEEKKLSQIKVRYIKINPLDPESYFIVFSFSSMGSIYEVGYSYIGYREYIHVTGLTLIFIILGCVLFIVVIMPFFYRESLVRPLDLLLNGVRKVNEGNLKVVVPVRVEDEIGYLSRSFNNMVNSIRDGERKLRDSLEYQVKLTETYSYFVPKEFLEFLKKESIIDIKLGDNVQEEMTILFSDIRSFTMLSEKMSPQENFNFLNSCLKRIGPVVRKNRGFIDKYIGDAVMALFPYDPSDALNAGVEMQRSVADYNLDREKRGYKPIVMGVGMHTGVLMLGTIGEERRMEGTVISDTVNLAARVESLTKLYGANVIASDVTLSQMKSPMNFKYRYLDRVKVKGKKKWVDIYEILDIELSEEIRKKFAAKNEFEKGVRLYQNKDIRSSLDCFSRILETSQEDKAVLLYINRCKNFIKHGVPDLWDGISDLENVHDR